MKLTIDIALAMLAFLSLATAVSEEPGLRAGALLRSRRILKGEDQQQQTTPMIQAIIDPYTILDGVKSVTYSLGNSSTQAFGYSDIPNRIPMAEDAHFPIASNSKLYTAVAIYQLYEQGLLDVDADIATMLDETDFEKFGITGVKEYCPQLGYTSVHNACETITLRQLLSMSSGIYPQLICDAVASTDEQCNRLPWFVRPDSLANFVGTFILEPLTFKPGTQYHYSNPNFVLASYFVEKYSGMTFQRYLQTNIFSRIGLNSTYYDFFNGNLELDEKRVKQFYKFYDNTTYDLLSVGSATLDLDLGAVAGTGGLVGSIQDQVTFWYSLFNRTSNGAPLLTNASSLDAILFPRIFVGAIPIGTITVQVYFGQGIVVFCMAEGCPDGPNYIYYTGGTLTVTTTNVMDYSNYIMSQVWTSNQVLATTRESFEALKESSNALKFEGEWMLPSEWSTDMLAIQQLFAVSPIGDSVGAG